MARIAKVFASTGELLVSSLAFGRDGALYAGTLPNGRIYRIDTKVGKDEAFLDPEGRASTSGRSTTTRSAGS